MWNRRRQPIPTYKNIALHDGVITDAKAERSDDKDDYKYKTYNSTPRTLEDHFKYTIAISIVCAVVTTILLMLLLYCIVKRCRKRNSCHDQNDGITASNDSQIVNTVPNYLYNGPYPPPYSEPEGLNRQRGNCAVFNINCETDMRYNQTHVVQDANPSERNPHTQIPGERQQTSVNPLSVSRLLGPQQNRNTVNPIFDEEPDYSISEQGSVNSDSDMLLRDLYNITERSIRQDICGKLVVSVTHLVGHAGDILYLDNMGISLKVPKGAVSRGKKEIIFLVLNWDLSDNPEMKSQESLVSPVVYVGPHGMKLNKPCTLTFRHCSYNSRQIRVMRSETELNVQKDWTVMADQSDVTGSCYFTADECQLKINAFTLYTCVQAPIEDQIGKKWLQIAVFACPLRKENNHHQIRVYFLNKTPCALQWAIQNEAKFGGKMVCPEKVFLFDGNALDMFAKTRYISKQWELVEAEDIDKISFIKIWHGHCPHISVCYRRLAPDSTHIGNPVVAIEMNLQLFTYQHTQEKDGEKIIIQIYEDDTTPKLSHESICKRHHLDKLIIDINPERCNDMTHSRNRQDFLNSEDNVHNINSQWPLHTRTFDDSLIIDHNTGSVHSTAHESSMKVVVHTNPNPRSVDDRFDLDNEHPVRRIPYALRKNLKIMLDAKHMFGSDWRDFAEKMDLNECIPILAHIESPTDKILDRVEQRGMTLEDLQNIFTVIGRDDCVEEVEKFKDTNTKAKTPMEHGDSSIMCHNGDSRFSAGHVQRQYRNETSRSLGENLEDINTYTPRIDGEFVRPNAVEVNSYRPTPSRIVREHSSVHSPNDGVRQRPANTPAQNSQERYSVSRMSAGDRFSTTYPEGPSWSQSYELQRYNHTSISNSHEDSSTLRPRAANQHDNSFQHSSPGYLGHGTSQTTHTNSDNWILYSRK